jgi:polysaccharide pyruvyl transferase WcaK-like protein
MVQTLLRYMPQAELICICSAPQAVQEKYRMQAIYLSARGFRSFFAKALNRMFFRLPARLAQLAYAWSRLRRVDVMIIPGTGALDDFGWSPFGYPFDMFIWCLAARLRGVKILFVSIGAGPIVKSVSRYLFKAVARMAYYRSFRDQESKDYMRGVGVRTDADEVRPDLVFGAVWKLDRRDISSKHITVGVGIMTYYGWNVGATMGARLFSRYVDKMTDIVIWLLAEGHKVRLLIGEQSDEFAVLAVRDRLRQKAGVSRDDCTHRLVFEMVRSLPELAEQIVDTDVIIATRFHNIVCALMCERPVVSIGYAFKNDALMREIGMGEFCNDIETFDVEEVKAQFTRLLRCRSDAARQIESKVKMLRQRLEEQNQVIMKLVERACQNG